MKNSADYRVKQSLSRSSVHFEKLVNDRTSDSQLSIQFKKDLEEVCNETVLDHESHDDEMFFKIRVNNPQSHFKKSGDLRSSLHHHSSSTDMQDFTKSNDNDKIRMDRVMSMFTRIANVQKEPILANAIEKLTNKVKGMYSD